MQADTLIQNLQDPRKKHQAENIRDNALRLARTLTEETVPQFSGMLNDTLQLIVKVAVTDQKVVVPAVIDETAQEPWVTMLDVPFLTSKIPIIIVAYATLAKITAPIKAAFAQVAG